MKINWFIVLAIMVGIICGIIIGMSYQQAITRATLVEMVSNTENFELNIDLNETKLVQEINETFTPIFKEIFEVKNETN